MTDVTGIILMVVLVAVLTFGFIMDGYSIFLRVTGMHGVAEVLAMANLVLYVSRISNVAVIFCLSLAFETGKLPVNVSLVFLLASISGVASIAALVHSKRFCNTVTTCLRPILHLSFREISKVYVWRELGRFRDVSPRLTGMSMLTNSLIVMAMFVPFGLAAVYPEMRMTSVYMGQLVNFLASFLVFSIQDPVSMRLVDGGALEKVGAALLYGRCISYFLVSLVFGLIWLM